MGMVSLQGGPFLTGFMMKLGATDLEVGLLTAVAMASQISQIGGLALLGYLGRRKPLTMLSMALYRCSWLLLGATPWILGLQDPKIALVIIALGEFLSALSAPAWSSWLKDAVPDTVRGVVMSRRMVLGTLVSMACTAGGGMYLDSQKSLGQEFSGYGVLFLAGVALGMVGLVAVSRLGEPEVELAPRVGVKEQLAAPLSDSNFKKLLAFIATWSFSGNLAAPFYMIYLVNELGCTMSTITLLTVGAQVTNLLSLQFWGRLSDSYSNKSVLAVCGPLFLATIAALLFTTLPEVHSFTMPILVGSYLLSGIATAGISVATTNVALKLAPHGKAAAYLTAYGLASAAAGAISPIVGGILSTSCRAFRLNLELSWVTGAGEGRVAPLALKGLEFVFLAAVLVGIFALHLLSQVKEEGEIDERQFRARLLAELGASLRGYSPLPGMKQLASIPLLSLGRILRRPKEGK